MVNFSGNHNTNCYKFNPKIYYIHENVKITKHGYVSTTLTMNGKEKCFVVWGFDMATANQSLKVLYWWPH